MPITRLPLPTAAFTLLLVTSAAGNAISRPSFSPEDVFQLEWAEDPRISPDASAVIYVRRGMSVQRDRREGTLWIVESDGSVHRKLTAAASGESSPRWSPDGDRIAYVASTPEGSEIHVHWLASGQSARLTQLERSPRNLTWSPDGRQLAFTMLVPGDPASLDVQIPKPPKDAEWAEKPRVVTRVKHEADGQGALEEGFHHVFVVPADGGSPRRLTDGDFHHHGPLAWTPDGGALWLSAHRSPNWELEFAESDLQRVPVAGGEVERRTERRGPDHDPVLSPDGSLVAWVGYEDRIRTYQLTDLWVMPTRGGEPRCLTSELDRSVTAPTWSADGRSILFRYEDQGDTHIGRVDLEGRVETLADRVGGTTIGRPYGGGSFTVARNGTLAWTHVSPERPADVAVQTPDEEAPRLLTRLNEDLLAHRTLGQVEEIRWASSKDGREIQGWVVTPPDHDPDVPHPLLLEIHGGPISNYGPRFSPEIQLYAAAGYVVLYANPRGSTGYGEAFGDLLYHDYPGGDYEDLMSGLDHMLARGDVDPDRLFVTGGSAGGILSAWMVGKTDRFRAAVVKKPVINWISKTLVADNYFGYANYRYPGQPWENPDAYFRASPLSLVGDIETPTMLIVGSEDLRTPLSEAKQLYHALKLRSVDTALVELPGASHHLAARPSQMIAKVAYTLAWFEKHDAAADGEADERALE